SDKTVAGSARRLARQVGVDFEPALLPAVRLLANHIADRQRERLAAAVDRICSRAPDSLPGTLVGAGVGRFMVSQLAQRRAMRYRDFGELPGMNGRSAAVAAPACVMAVLASRAARAARP
ncbi:MAG: S-layer protein, partial [Gammaproteobacteria bacterium]|nr:S-layer protein [Gammaproteobacteria bacterium]